MINKSTKLFTLLVVLFSICGTSGYASNVRGITSYPESARQAVELINCLPEARDLLERIEAEGNIAVEFARENSEFEAYWMGGSRTIVLNPHYNRVLGQQICNIIFELHNASTESKMEKQAHWAYHGAISKAEYVEGIERIEHQNALEACRILDLGIKKRLFPKEAAAFYEASFEEYFARQKETGHSDFIARDFDRIAPHRSHERDDMSHYAAIKNDLNSRDRDRIVNATLQLNEEFKKFEQEKQPNQRRKQMFYQTFSGNPIFDSLAR